MDAITLVNLILSSIILIMGIWAYMVDKIRSILYVGMAFGLFALSHLCTILGLEQSLEVPLIIVRLLAYLLVIYAIYIVIAKKKKA
ncbi:MAG: hypothetical protein JXA01_07980 [Dehalococcoidia bacterium]|nr:hypothetical protein [Dehalococcoidia bacterium]